MERKSQIVTLLDAVTPVAVTSSTDATPIVVTATAHGLSTGDIVQIIGHTTNIAANGRFKVTRLTADTFSLQDEFTGANVAGTGGGAGASGVLIPAPPVLLVQDTSLIILQIGSSGSTTATLKAAGSLGKSKASSSGARGDIPNFAGTIAPSNPWSYIQIIPIDTQTALAGATGLVLSGTDVNLMYKVNAEAIKYFSLILASWTQGAITVKALIAGNNS